MILYEVLISAVPSFVLSLQPNTSRVKGKFIPFVISRALPGAITMALGIITLDILHQSTLSYIFDYTAASGETVSLYEPMLILALTFTGLVMLLRICRLALPFLPSPRSASLCTKAGRTSIST